MRAAGFWCVLLLCAAATARPDVYHLQDGDRITGKTLSQAGGQYRVQTAYGRVTIPKAKIHKIVRDDGSEERVGAPEPVKAAEPTPPPPPPVQLVFVVTGASFWQAWSPAKDVSPDPALRLAISMDEETLVSYTDSQVDPEIPGALVNAFSFDAGHVTLLAREDVVASPPEARPGRISLRLGLPLGFAGEHRVRVAYQSNDGSALAPAWRDLAAAAIHAELEADALNFVHLRQDRGQMEFSGFGRKRMKNVETFRIEMGME